MNPSPTHPIDRSTWELLALTRFVLAMIVLANHAGFFYVNSWATTLANMSSFVAVACFLVISGYSIAHSISKNSTGFYRRRFARIYPLYAIAVIGPLLYQHVLLHHVSAGELRDSVCSLAFTQTFFTNLNPLNTVLWSLAIEMACYLLAPLFVRCTTVVLLTLTAGSALAFAAYPGLTHPAYYAYLHNGAPLALLLWAWLGGFIYYRHQRDPSALVMLGFFVLVLPTVNRFAIQNLYFIPIVVMLAALYAGPRLRMVPWLGALMLYLGEVSYPLYVFHYPILVAMADRDRLSPNGPTHPMLPGQWVVPAIAVASDVGVAAERVLRRQTMDLCDRAFVRLSHLWHKCRPMLTPVRDRWRRPPQARAAS